MKNVLIVLTQSENSSLTNNEMVQALLVFASFGIRISVLFEDGALNLLNQSQHSSHLQHRDAGLPLFKSVRDMVASFEFYDIDSLFIHTHQQHAALLKNCSYTLTPIVFNRDFVSQFDHVIYN